MMNQVHGMRQEDYSKYWGPGAVLILIRQFCRYLLTCLLTYLLLWLIRADFGLFISIRGTTVGCTSLVVHVADVGKLFGQTRFSAPENKFRLSDGRQTKPLNRQGHS